jgi:hypothetical protein
MLSAFQGTSMVRGCHKFKTASGIFPGIVLDAGSRMSRSSFCKVDGNREESVSLNCYARSLPVQQQGIAD